MACEPLLKKFLSPLGYTFEKPRNRKILVDTVEPDKVYFTDSRLNERTFNPVEKNTKLEDERLSITRGMKKDMKALYLNYVNSSVGKSRYFNAFYNSSLWNGFTDDLSKKILNLALNTRSKGIYEISPLCELGLLVSSGLYNKKLLDVGRSFTEGLLFKEQEDFIRRLNLKIDNIFLVQERNKLGFISCNAFVIFPGIV